MSVEKAREKIQHAINITSVSADNDNYYVPLTIANCKSILSELDLPEPSGFTKHIRHNIQVNRERGNVEYESIFKEFLQACDTIDRLEAENKRQAEIIKDKAMLYKKKREDWLEALWTSNFSFDDNN